MALHQLLVPLLIAWPLLPIWYLDLITGNFSWRLFTLLLLLGAILGLAFRSRSLLCIPSLIIILETLDGIEPLLFFLLEKLFPLVILCEVGLGRSFMLLGSRFCLEVC